MFLKLLAPLFIFKFDLSYYSVLRSFSEEALNSFFLWMDIFLKQIRSILIIYQFDFRKQTLKLHFRVVFFCTKDTTFLYVCSFVVLIPTFYGIRMFSLLLTVDFKMRLSSCNVYFDSMCSNAPIAVVKLIMNAIVSIKIYD